MTSVRGLRSLARLHLIALTLLAAAAPAQADPASCQIILVDALGQPVNGATVSCAGLAAHLTGNAGVYVASGDAPAAPTMAVRIDAAGYLPVRLTLGRSASTVAWVRRPGEPYLIRGGLEMAFVAEPEHLLINLDRYDRAAGRQLSRDQALADLAPLLARWHLVVASSRGAAPVRNLGGRCGDPESEVVLAQASGRSFSSTHVGALAALRRHPRVRAAGPLVRLSPTTDGELALGHVITVNRWTADPPLAEFARRHRATWDPARRQLRLPTRIGLAAATVLNELVLSLPDVSADLDLDQKECTD